LLLHGMRPLTVIVPRVRRSSASVDDMAIAARADVAAGVHGATADGAEGAAALHQLGRAPGKGLGLLAADANARRGGPFALALARFAHGAGGEEVGLLVVVRLAHLRPKALRSPALELTVRTATPDGR